MNTENGRMKKSEIVAAWNHKSQQTPGNRRQIVAKESLFKR